MEDLKTLKNHELNLFENGSFIIISKGMVIYFLYGKNHSMENKRMKKRNGALNGHEMELKI